MRSTDSTASRQLNGVSSPTQSASQEGRRLNTSHKYLANGKLTRIRHGVYRLVHFLSGEDEDLVVLWL